MMNKMRKVTRRKLGRLSIEYDPKTGGAIFGITGPVEVFEKRFVVTQIDSVHTPSGFLVTLQVLDQESEGRTPPVVAQQRRGEEGGERGERRSPEMSVG